MTNTEEKDDEFFINPPRIISWIISCVFFMQMIDGTILNTALPEIAKELKQNPLEMQSVVIAYMLTVAALLPISGWIAERFGIKKIFIIAISIFTIGSLFCALSQNLMSLVLSRVVQGIGGALMTPTGRLIILKVYPKKMLVKVLSLIMLPALLGPIMGPPLGGFFVEYLSWHWIFIVNLPIGIITICLIKKLMPEIDRENVKKFDWTGFSILSTALILICVASNKSSIITLTVTYKAIMLIVAIALIYIFWKHINKCSKPLFKPQLREFPSFTIGIVGNLLTRLGFGAMPLLMPLFLQVGLKFSPSKSGMIMLTLGIAAITGKFIVEKLLNILGYRKLLIINTMLIGVMISSILLIGKETSETTIVFILFLVGILNSIQFTSMNTVTLIDLPKKYSSDGNSLLSVVMQTSVVLGISIGSSILSVFEKFYGDENVLDAFHSTFLFLGMFTILSCITFSFIPRKAGGLKK